MLERIVKRDLDFQCRKCGEFLEFKDVKVLSDLISLYHDKISYKESGGPFIEVCCPVDRIVCRR